MASLSDANSLTQFRLGLRIGSDTCVSRGRCQAKASWGRIVLHLRVEGSDMLSEVDAVGDVSSVEALLLEGLEPARVDAAGIR